MSRLSYYLSHPRFVFVALIEKYGGWIPDKPYIRLSYYLHTGKRLHLNPARSFNEKIQWLKLNDRKPLYPTLVDKYAVKEYVAKIIGDEYIIPSLGVWEKTEDIDFKYLPQRFVLKTTHDGGGEGVIVCDKNSPEFDINIIKNKLNHSLKRSIYKALREWPYKNIKPRIMAEVFIQQASDTKDPLNDYKFFCFNGEPKFCQVKSHEDGKDCIDLFDMNWDLLPFSGLNPAQKNAVTPPKKPINYEQMVLLVKKLCGVSSFVRVDFYNVKGAIYFGEITFYPASGLGRFSPEEYDLVLGELLMIDSPAKE